MEHGATPAASAAEDHRRAATAYLVWPLAVANIIRESPADTAWSRLHARQACVYGVAITAALAAILAVPAVVVVVDAALDFATTIVWYGIALGLAAVVSTVAYGAALVYARRAARGELFAIPLVTAFVDRVMPLDRGRAPRGRG